MLRKQISLASIRKVKEVVSCVIVHPHSYASNFDNKSATFKLTNIIGGDGEPKHPNHLSIYDIIEVSMENIFLKSSQHIMEI